MRMCQGEIGVNVDRPTKQGYGRRAAGGEGQFLAGAVSLQGLERRCRTIGKRRRMLLHCRERFPQPSSEFTNDLTQGVQDVFSLRRLDLLLIENASGVAVLGTQAQDKLAPKGGD